MAQLFAANHPERVLSLAMYGSAVPHKYRPLVQARFEAGDAPIPTNKQISERFMKVADTWGETPPSWSTTRCPARTATKA